MSSRFEISNTGLQDLKVITRKPIQDKRGYLERLYCADELAECLGGKAIKQINRTLTVEQGTVRGLHFQHPPHAETKFISCIRGKVFDVAVDLRRASPTFLQWHAVLLSADNQTTFVIPEGFAHGFQTLSEDCELLYMHTASYHPESEGGLNVLDPTIGIDWPEPVRGLSPRDEGHPLIDASFPGIEP